jgi:hypothetical protein
MSLFSRLFGGSSAPDPGSKPELYKDFRIFADPVRVAGGFRVSARIEKDIGGETRTHQMVRADTCDSLDTALEMTANKAKMLIDQQGDAIFDR